MRECHYDFDMIKVLFNRMQSHLPNSRESKNRTTRRYLSQCKDVYQNLMQRKFKETKQVTPYDISNHILKLLKSA